MRCPTLDPASLPEAPIAEAPTHRLGLVLSGGGARGAYEAGVLHYMRSALPPEARNAKIDVICGTSVGAINAAFLASTAKTPALQGELLNALWEHVQQGRIFRRDWSAVAKFIVLFGAGLGRNFLHLDPGHARVGKPSRDGSFVSLFDTTPLPEYLASLIDFAGIRSNLDEGYVDALALAATNLDSDETEVFIQTRGDLPYRGDYRFHETELDARHVMASAAIPFAFPPVQIGSTYYCDGGLRLHTPMSPAIHLGADRLLVIGTHGRHEKRFPELRAPSGTPSPGRLLAAVTDAVLQDKLRYDLEQLGRINRIIEWAQIICEPDFLARLNEHVFAAGETGDIASRGLKRIDALHISPSRDVGEVFRDQLHKNPYLDESFSPFERFAMRLFALDPREGRELFSYLVFAPRYVRALLDLGYQDAKARHDDLCGFFAGRDLPMSFPQLVH